MTEPWRGIEEEAWRHVMGDVPREGGVVSDGALEGLDEASTLIRRAQAHVVRRFGGMSMVDEKIRTPLELADAIERGDIDA